MKKNIHPKTYTNCVVTCACGNTFTTISTQEKMTIDICNACHPFYTGKQKFVDTEGRVEKILKKIEIAKKAPKKTKKVGSETLPGTQNAPKSKTLKEMLEEAQKAQIQE